DWVLSLPNDADQRFWKELTKFEETRNMPYITSVERIGMEKGFQKGIQQGIQQGIQIGEQRGEQRGTLNGMIEILLDQLQEKFGPVPEWGSSKLAEADQDTLKTER
ncbi:MAG: hypothetical protein H7829_01895, partial [Magnetococcus sp. THC-1_WYH]